MEGIVIKCRDFRTPNGELLKVHYRAGTSDERVLVEVIDKACYRKRRTGFDVLPGEHWLDLGANIGAFAVYCRLHGAKVTCYEPDPECFELLRKNAPWALKVEAAVTKSKETFTHLWHSPTTDDHYRNTLHPTSRYTQSTLVNNENIFDVPRKFDGIKMDIEGSEGPILDSIKWALPSCNKLIMEYHTSKDSSVHALQRRISVLQRHFKHVHYPPEFDRVFASGATEFKAYFDRLIWAWEPL